MKDKQFHVILFEFKYFDVYVIANCMNCVFCTEVHCTIILFDLVIYLLQKYNLLVLLAAFFIAKFD